MCIKGENMSEKMKSIMVFIEQDEGRIENSSLGVLSKAREEADKHGYKVYAAILGHNIADKANELGEYGAHHVVIVEHPILRYYHSEAYATGMSMLIERYKPDILLASATRNGRDLFARLAVKYRTGLMAHVIDFYIENDALIGVVPGFGGSIAAVVKHVKGWPQLATVSPGIFEARRNWGQAENVEKTTLGIDESMLRIKIVERRVGEMVDLSQSRKVVVAGMGTEGRLEIAEELAKVLGADIGVTRPLADIGVAPRDLQIGSTGVSLKAELVVVLGASGAPHFVSGIRDAGTVVSINIDPEAPIRDYSDYFAVGDVFEIVPLLIEELRKKAKGGETS